MPASDASQLGCPRCGKALGPIRHRGIELDGCASCQGTLVPIRSLTPLLEATSVDLLATFDPDTEIEPLAAREERAACPRCARPMESADYCAAQIVWFDRCDRCSL